MQQLLQKYGVIFKLFLRFLTFYLTALKLVLQLLLLLHYSAIN